MIAVIDYDAGNIRSVEKALISLGEQVHITGDAEKILSADKVILPGVGAFGDAMANIRRKIEKNPAQPQYIFTEVGVGYRMADED